MRPAKHFPDPCDLKCGQNVGAEPKLTPAPLHWAGSTGRDGQDAPLKRPSDLDRSRAGMLLGCHLVYYCIQY